MPQQEIEIQAAVAHAPDKAFSTDTLLLRNPGAHEIGVRIVACGICHTDVTNKKNGLCPFPMVLGHEGVGIVDTIGADVTGFEVGDHVILSYDYCGQCAQCKKDKPSYCDLHGTLNFGGVRPDGSKTHRNPGSADADVNGSYFQQSSFATYAISHPSNTIKVDKSLPLAALAPLGCGVQTGAGTVFNTLGIESGTSLAVFGCGCVGLSAIMAAKIARATTIVAVDINPARLALAREFGATHCVNPNELADATATAERVKTASPDGALNYAIDTTGIPDVLRQAFDCCGPMGVTAMIAPGLPGMQVSVEMFGLLPGKSLRGVIQGDAVSKSFIPHLIALWQQGRFPFDRMITRYDGLDMLESAVAEMERGEVIKPVIVIDSGLQSGAA